MLTILQPYPCDTDKASLSLPGKMFHERVSNNTIVVRLLSLRSVYVFKSKF